ncbi:DUF2254 domain-containing protein [Alteribacter aurantiacus]|uniref:DUF2254 domain-containing protein n=1 Tax=Alteribacter aurantiacus TaxID=254410 RepID=UPI00040C5CDE|nr:DUF2254 domain-containing protein [Alteribacter aurantiacus]
MVTRVWIFIRGSYWFIPTIYGIIAIILSFVSHQIDQYIWMNPQLLEKIPPILLSDFDLAYTILGTIAASILTMTSISFSSILVVMTTYVTQFSPRSLQNFITDPHTQRILGVFISGFLYAIVLLLLTKQVGASDVDVLVSPVLAVVIAIVAVGFFVFFVHHVAKWIQIRNLIQSIYKDTVDVMDRFWENRSDAKPDDPWDDWEDHDILARPCTKVRSDKSGYIQWIDFEGLKNQGEEDGAIVEMLYSHGDYLAGGLVLMNVYSEKKNVHEKDYRPLVVIGTERESIQDVRYGIVKLVEISVRSLSPGVNDPFTAIEGIKHLGHLLATLCSKSYMENHVYDKDGNLRVLKKVYVFHDYLYQSYFQIRLYGGKDSAILGALLDSLYEVATHGTALIKKDVWSFTEYVVQGIEQESFLNWDLSILQDKLDRIAVIAAPGKKDHVRLRQPKKGFNHDE